MRRTAALGVLAAVVLAWSWLRLERGTLTLELAFWATLYGVLPALLPSARLRIAAVLVTAVLGVRHAVGTLWPGEAIDRFSEGFYLYYDIALPFDSERQPLMHALVVLAVLGFTLAVSFAVAHRRPVLAATLLVAGAAWPATLLTSSNTSARGAIILAAALAVIGGLSSVARFRQVALAAAAVVAAAVGLAGLPAVAKGAFLGWETWEPARPEALTNVRYVWNTSYATLTWPEKKTTVLTIEAPPISRYWRATTLDVFADDVWLEVGLPSGNEPLVDPLLPQESQRVDRQLRAEVKVEALQDRHLFGASVPVRYDAGDLDVRYQQTGTAIATDDVPRGTTYTSWSYAVRPSPQLLARSAPSYPAALDRYRVVEGRYTTPPTPSFGTEGRRADIDNIFAVNPGLEPYRPLYDEALRVAGEAPSPYAAVVALETYFHDGDRYTYDQDPFSRQGLVPPLVEFVTDTHAGYCQHFASAMALMLRYLGIPARVGAGFTSGSYNQETGSWTVTDHDAHTWVEVWFRGFGWLPFDPTPGRGDLDGAYSAASRNFDADVVTAAIAAGAGVASGFRLGPEPPEGVGATREAPGRDIPGDVGVAVGGGDQESLLRLLALVAAGLAGGIALLKLVLRRSRYLTRNPRRVAGACRRELTEFLADQGVDVDGSATFAELGEVVRAQAAIDPTQFVAAAQVARYGPLDDSGAAARRTRRELRRVVRGLRSRLSVWQRTRGLVSLRSLGLS